MYNGIWEIPDEINYEGQEEYEGENNNKTNSCYANVIGCSVFVSNRMREWGISDSDGPKGSETDRNPDQAG